LELVRILFTLGICFNQRIQEQFDVTARLFYDGRGEVDFIIQNGMEIIPVEVKSGESKSATSFKSYIKKHNPQTAIRFSKLGYRTDGKITNLPLYLARKTNELV
jgi:Holliday junction resolvase-like predicted endonuclease